MPPEYITTAEAAKRNGLSVRYVQRLCMAGKVRGAQLVGSSYIVPASFKWKPQKVGRPPKK